MTIQNSEIADILFEIADLLEIEDANPFRIRAYREAARTIESYPRRINEIADKNEAMKQIPGIGRDLASKIKEIVATGNLSFLETLHERIPPSLIELLDISGLGPKRVQKLFYELGITNIEELRASIEAGKVAKLDGFGPKTVKNILNQLESELLHKERTRLDIAEQFIEPLIEYLEAIESVKKAVIAGSYRRRKSTIGDLDIIAISQNGKNVSDAFVKYDSVDEILSQGEKKASIKLKSGLQVDLRIVSEDSYGAALLYFTGSKAHNINLRNIASGEDLKINEYGVFEDGIRILGKTEDEIYTHLNMPYIVPELRENNGEIKSALEDSLPTLVDLKDIRGDLQMHTIHSDGDHTISAMARAAEEMGYEYMAVTDHTSYIGVTKGLDEDHIAEYLQEIDEFNNGHNKIHVLKGIEVDIHKDGSLDLSDSALKEMDIVLGAVHSHFNLNERDQTERILRAMDNPYLNILAHPTTRRIGSRDPMDLDMEKIMQGALQRKCYLEINANPERLDIWDHYIRLAGSLGLNLAISTDAHRKSGLKNMKYGVYQARRGWAQKTQIINTRSLTDLITLLTRD